MKRMNRRDFLRTSGAAAAATLAATPGLTYAQMVGSGAPFGDYKALVCIFMFGGNDSFNMVVPSSNAEYNAYAASRQNLAINQQDLLAINPQTSDGATYGLHPAMSSLQQLFNNTDDVALVSNVGPLIEPTTRDQIYNQSVDVPPQLFSHNDQQDQWLSLRGKSVSKTGWAGRMADLIRINVAGQQMATNASLFGNNTFQAADDTVPYVMGQNGPDQFAYMSSDPNAGLLYDQGLAFGRIIDAQFGSIYERGFAQVQRRAIDNAELVSGAIQAAEDSGAITTVFPQGQLGTQLSTVAKLIASRDLLQMERQVFFVATGGFDSHDNQNQDQPGLLANISECISAFHSAMTNDLQIGDEVTTFTQSDFGRTLTSNGDGTDHAWGGNQIVVGGAVNGRDMYGPYPSLELGQNNPDDVGGGRLIPATSADQYAATLAKWFGIPDVDLDIVAPHIDNFMQRDLGFMV